MFSYAFAGARAAGLAMLAAALLAACGSDDSDSPAQPATPAASRLVVDTGSAAPVAGGTLTLKATLLAADGTEVKGASFAWTSSDETVATVLSASDKAPTAAAPVGIYATIRTLAAGRADITATATLPDGSRIASVTHLTVQAAPAVSYTLTLTPATLTVVAGAAAQTVSVAVRRSDGVDGVADLANWSWTSDDASFVVTPAADGRGAKVASPGSAYSAAAATLTACADAPAGTRLCANAALTRNTSLPPTYTVGGTVSGLAAGKSLQLADISGDTQVIAGNGVFTMPTPRLGASSYAVSVSAQPAGQTCSVTRGTGTVASANVADIAVACVQAQFVVVANRADQTFSVYRVDPASGALAAVPGSPFTSGDNVNDIAFLPNGQVGYAVMPNTNRVVSFRLDPATGAMAEIPGSARSSVLTAPQAVTVHPTGRSLIVGAGRGIVWYPIDPASLVPASGGSYEASGLGQTRDVEFSPDGLYLYTANSIVGQISKFPIASNGGVIGFGSIDYSVGVIMPSAMSFSPDGRTLLYTSEQDGLLGVGTVDPAGGQIQSSQLVPTAPFPSDVAMTPSGQFAFVLSGIGAGITGYKVVSPGVVPLPGIAPTGPGSGSGRLKVEPGGRRLYVAMFNQNLVSGFSIDATTGALTPIPGSPFPTGFGNTSIAIVEPRP
ncbi:beta-propeller fold lactonase family protein [Cupriavidus sp. SZY C1]|uniref:lactonase family protein n=1 Tax=Cupriavidus sp. SZY C1 TaxID=3055037 RepID=UPI0028B9F718|nr:beta-propeller fold lactonase family protein [Cupriavidus sp. SZY C1]MDT6963118.1 beta-propeller fold lactonase family protein [Cupriavidus sp. SZY C1]